MSRRLASLALAAAMTVGACAPRYQATDYALAQPEGPYQLASGDKLRIIVFGQDNLSNVYAVDGSGHISMPLISTVPAQGRTTQELARTQEHLFVLGRRGACEKVASFLISAAKRARSDLTPLAMSRQDIADYLGLTIETVSRMLSQLQSGGIVEFVGCRSFRVIQPSGLARLVTA